MSFPLIGNKRVKDSLSAIIASNRIPHAVIIEGDAGTGKRTLAKYLAKVAVCEGDIPPCETCRGCHLADIGTHPDIEVVAPEEKKKNIGVEQIRNLRTTAYHSAHTAKRRAFIIEQADTMNASSQNSLLKVLEEPPSDVLFILVVGSAERLLDTVVSRCVTLSLFPPSIEDGVKLLRDKHGIKEDEATQFLKAEGGNIGKALSLITKSNESLGKAAARDFLDAVLNGSAVDALVTAAPLEKDRPEALKFAEELSEIIINKIKESGAFTETAREYSRMYTALWDLVPTLNTNINLSLFFTALTSKLMAVKDK
jgi:DNA polymerase-3 subunit delta'